MTIYIIIVEHAIRHTSIRHTHWLLLLLVVVVWLLLLLLVVVWLLLLLLTLVSGDGSSSGKVEIIICRDLDTMGTAGTAGTVKKYAAACQQTIVSASSSLN